ncbi:hypothetical protein [[Eubacterium] cellulosolvens]
MGSNAVLYKEIDGTEYSVDLPLTSNVNANEVREELGLPPYIDLKYFPMQNALATIWAAINAPEMHRSYPDVFEKKICGDPIPALLMGGGAVKFLCKSSNGKGGLSRPVKDVDFIVRKKQSWKFFKLLLSMGKALGSRFYSFATSNDRRFNAWRRGERYRLTTINGITKEGIPTITVADILCDSIDFRHKIEVKDAFDTFKTSLYTIGLEYLLLSKTQFIMDLPKEDFKRLQECNLDYRVLSYPYYEKDRIILGMEEKDVKDVCSIFLDHPIGGPDGVNVQKLKKILKDKKLALTVTLNLKNLADHPDVIGRWTNRSEVSAITERVNSLLKELPKVEKQWDKPWWNTAVETPVIE